MIDLRIKQIKKYGFTLVELLISISIIAILAVVLSISFSNAQRNARDQRRIEDLKAIQSAAEQYFLLKGSYPTASGTWSVNGQVVLQTYPVGPKGAGVGDTYVYSYSAATGNYYAYTLMENSKNANANIVGSTCDFQPSGTRYCVKNQQ